MEQFDFQRAESLEEAQAAVRASQDGKFMAGGQSLIPLLKLEMASPDRIVSISGLGALAGISLTDATLVIGAATTHASVASSDEVRDAIPALSDLAGMIGDPQVRNRGTLGGSVAHADPAADYSAALLALGATVVTDRRQIAAEDFFLGMFQTPMESDEIITAVRFPVPEAASYAKFANPASKYAIVGVMVARTSGGVRVAVTGAATNVFRESAMEEALASDFSAAALDNVSVAADRLLSDLDASSEYRAHLITVMAKQAVRACG